MYLTLSSPMKEQWHMNVINKRDDLSILSKELIVLSVPWWDGKLITEAF